MSEHLPKQAPQIRQQTAERRLPPVRDITHPRELRKGEFGDYHGNLYRGLGNGRYQLVGGGEVGPVGPAGFTGTGGLTASDLAAHAALPDVHHAQAHHASHHKGGSDALDGVLRLAGLEIIEGGEIVLDAL